VPNRTILISHVKEHVEKACPLGDNRLSSNRDEALLNSTFHATKMAGGSLLGSARSCVAAARKSEPDSRRTGREPRTAKKQNLSFRLRST
jgi:hypothetical protein